MAGLPSCGKLAVVGERDHFIEELDVLGGRRVLDKTAEFSKETQAKNESWAGMVEMIVCVIPSMMSCGGVPAESRCCMNNCCFHTEKPHAGVEWVDMMVLYCQRSAAEDHEFSRRINVLLQEMVVVYDDFYSGAGGCEATEVAEHGDRCEGKGRSEGQFYCEALMCFSMAALPRCDELHRAINSLEWEDMFMLYCRRAINDDLRLVREINALCAGLTAIIEERDNFVDELEVLVDRFVPKKMAKFMKETQGKDTPNLMKFQILKRESELRAR
nr:hypothetical protein [Tanacetum cinerariifolium]